MTVVPFYCDEIATCLDGFTNPPSYAQCVALGPTREDSIRLDFDRQSGNDMVGLVMCDGMNLQATPCCLSHETLTRIILTICMSGDG